MIVEAIPVFTDNYIWMIRFQNSAICVDPGEAKPVINYLHQHHLMLTDILITHHHDDHIGGIKLLVDYFPLVKVHAPPDQRIPMFNQTHLLKDNVDCQSLQFKVLMTPGHTSSHVCYYQPQYKWLFCGDTLFSAGCGRVFDGSIKALFNSLELLATLPDETMIFPAHEYTLNNLKFAHHVEPDNLNIQHAILKLQHSKLPCSLPSTMAFEKKVNPFIRATQAPKNFNKFKILRTLKDDF